MAASPQSIDGDSSLGPPEPWRSVISLAIFVHLFCVLATMSANYGRSALQSRLLDVLGPYTQLIHADLGYAQFQLTDGFPDADYFVEFQLPSVTTPAARLPEAQWRGSLTRLRPAVLARRMGIYSLDESAEPFVGELARAAGGAWLREQQQEHVVVRVVRRLTASMTPEQLQPPRPTDPSDPEYLETVYEADVFRSDDGTVNLVKREGRGTSAPPSTSTQPPTQP